MFERYFQRVMRYGARLLFGLAVLLVLMGFVEGLARVVALAGPGDRDRTTWLYNLKFLWNGLASGWPFLLGETLRGLSSAAFPLFAALVVHRIDQWIARRDHG